MQAGVLVTDVEGVIIYSNPAAHLILGRKDTQLHGHPVAAVLANWLPEALSAWNEEKEEIQLILGESQTQFFWLTISKLTDNTGESIGSLLTFNNNTDQKNYEKRLSELASYDSLTGSYNRRFFFEMAQVYFNQMQRTTGPLSVLMLDLDHFKQINDTYGHVKGDLVLQKVAAICKSLVRPQDIFARYGGEEFVLAMPETSVQEACIVAERLRAAIECLKNEVEGVPITVSIGVIQTTGEPGMTLDTLLNRADEAMYRSKHDGRNRVTAWEET
jgi:diguanylate cyclase (GGDEF)-like protein